MFVGTFNGLYTPPKFELPGKLEKISWGLTLLFTLRGKKMNIMDRSGRHLSMGRIFTPDSMGFATDGNE